MADLRDLERLCNGLPDRIEVAANKLAKGVTVVMDVDLVDHTPVDTSEALSNWQVSLNSAPTFDLPAIVPGERGSTAQQSRSEAKAHAERFLAMKDPGEKVYLSNLTPYVIDLNGGSSKQEPAGFFERALLLGELFLAKAKLEL